MFRPALLPLKPVSDHPTGSAAIARRRLLQTLQRERALLRERNADQMLLTALLSGNLPAPPHEA
ncbi:MAG: hypothetical protein K6356_06935 [Chloroflexus sp.]